MVVCLDRLGQRPCLFWFLGLPPYLFVLFPLCQGTQDSGKTHTSVSPTNKKSTHYIRSASSLHVNILGCTGHSPTYLAHSLPLFPSVREPFSAVSPVPFSRLIQ